MLHILLKNMDLTILVEMVAKQSLKNAASDHWINAYALYITLIAFTKSCRISASIFLNVNIFIKVWNSILHFWLKRYRSFLSIKLLWNWSILSWFIASLSACLCSTIFLVSFAKGIPKPWTLNHISTTKDIFILERCNKLDLPADAFSHRFIICLTHIQNSNYTKNTDLDYTG